MNRKKVVKSIAAAGVAFGGVSIFQDGDVVYAQEMDTIEANDGGEDYVVELPKETSMLESDEEMLSPEIIQAEEVMPEQGLEVKDEELLEPEVSEGEILESESERTDEIFSEGNSLDTSESELSALESDVLDSTEIGSDSTYDTESSMSSSENMSMMEEYGSNSLSENEE